MTTPLHCLLRALIGALAMTAALHGQAQEEEFGQTWVSGVGDDANPCSREAPCKTFAGAISKTAAGGVMTALDPGGFGSVTILKSITIDGGRPLAGISTGSTNGIVVNTSDTDRVVLRNLDIFSAVSLQGLVGILVRSVGYLQVESVRIDRMATAAIRATGPGVVDLRKVQLSTAPAGILVEAAATVAVTDSVVRDMAVALSASQGSISVQGSTLVGNTTAIQANGGAITSFGDNKLSGNGADGAFSSTMTFR